MFVDPQLNSKSCPWKDRGEWCECETFMYNCKHGWQRDALVVANGASLESWATNESTHWCDNAPEMQTVLWTTELKHTIRRYVLVHAGNLCLQFQHGLSTERFKPLVTRVPAIVFSTSILSTRNHTCWVIRTEQIYCREAGGLTITFPRVPWECPGKPVAAALRSLRMGLDFRTWLAQTTDWWPRLYVCQAPNAYVCQAKPLPNTKCVCMYVTKCVCMCVTKCVYMCVTKCVCWIHNGARFAHLPLLASLARFFTV